MGARLVAAQHSGYDSLDPHLALLNVDRLELSVRRLEPDSTIALPIVALHRRRLAVEHRDDHLAVVGRLTIVNDAEVAVADMVFDHRIAADLEHVMIACAPNEILRTGDRSARRELLVRNARGDRAKQGKV